jgi:flagellar motility protein MotE (MotC chaperone)
MSSRFKLPRAALARAGVALQAAAFLAAPALAQDNGKPKPAAPIERSADGEIARYCAALAPSAREARAAYQLRRLAELVQDVRDEAAKLEVKEAAARDWVTKREAMMKSATDDVVAIYAKMAPDAAATQLAAMDEPMAAALLAKLKPQTAGAILGEMQADKAAKLSSLIAGQPGGDKT